MLGLPWSFVVALAAAGPVFATEPSGPLNAVGAESMATRSITVIQQDVDAALRAEAITRRRGANAAEVVRLTELFRELAVHPKRDESFVAWELGVKLRSRLREVSGVVEKRGAAARKHEKESGELAARDGGALDPEGRAALRPDQDGRAMLQADRNGRAMIAPESRVLAQQLPAPRGAGGQVVAPGVALPAAQPAAGQVVDYGPQLVELIQATISPGTWNINGGPGAVVYYQPLRVLVVSAPGDVQNQIGGVVGRLRRP